jgi:hypothetical protein
MVGQTVARAAKLFQTDGLHIELVKVTKLDGEKVYLDHSTRPIKFPDRVAIL